MKKIKPIFLPFSTDFHSKFSLHVMHLYDLFILNGDSLCD